MQTLDGILAAANAAGKQVQMDISNGWYLASFFLGNGLHAGAGRRRQAGVCDFNSPAGLAAAEAVRAFCNDPAFTPGDDSFLMGAIGDSVCAGGQRQSWCAEAISEKLGRELRRLQAAHLHRGRGNRCRWVPSSAARSSA